MDCLLIIQDLKGLEADRLIKNTENLHQISNLGDQDMIGKARTSMEPLSLRYLRKLSLKRRD